MLPADVRAHDEDQYDTQGKTAENPAVGQDLDGCSPPEPTERRRQDDDDEDQIENVHVTVKSCPACDHRDFAEEP